MTEFDPEAVILAALYLGRPERPNLIRAGHHFRDGGDSDETL
jgi:hypothetical protein